MGDVLKELGFEGIALVAVAIAGVFVVFVSGIEASVQYKQSPRAQDCMVWTKLWTGMIVADLSLGASIWIWTESVWFSVLGIGAGTAACVGLGWMILRLHKKDDAEGKLLPL